MVVRDHEFDAGQASFAKTKKKVAPTRPALAVGEFHGEDLPAAFPVHGDGNQHGLVRDDPAFADALVTGIEDEIGIGVGQAAF